MVKMRCRTSSDIALLLLCWFIAGCSGLQVRGIIAGQTLESRVDSEIARYYLADYLAGNPAAPALDSRIDQVYEKINGHIPDHNELKEISSEFSPDFAALFFADEIARKPLNRRFREIFDKSYNYTREAFPKNQLQLPEAAAN